MEVSLLGRFLILCVLASVILAPHAPAQEANATSKCLTDDFMRPADRIATCRAMASSSGLSERDLSKVLTELAKAYHESDQDELALADLKQVLSTNPKDWHARTELCQIYFDTNEISLARIECQVAQNDAIYPGGPVQLCDGHFVETYLDNGPPSEFKKLDRQLVVEMCTDVGIDLYIESSVGVYRVLKIDGRRIEANENISDILLNISETNLKKVDGEYSTWFDDRNFVDSWVPDGALTDAYCSFVSAIGAQGNNYISIVDAGIARASSYQNPSKAYARRGDEYEDCEIKPLHINNPEDLRPMFFDSALQKFNLAISLRPDLPGAYGGRAWLRILARQYDLALKDLNQSVPIKHDLFDVTNRCEVRALLGVELTGGLADCNEALHRRPGSQRTLLWRGMIFLKTHQPSSAIGDFSAVLSADPKSAWALYGRGLAEKKVGKVEAGDADVNRAIAMDPDIASRFKADGIVA